MLPEDFPGSSPAEKVYHWKQWLLALREQVPDMDADTRTRIRTVLEDRQTRTRLPDDAIALLAALRECDLDRE
jgi:hypothetical protein